MLCLTAVFLSLATVGCVEVGSNAPPAETTVTEKKIAPAVEKFVDEEERVICYIKRSEYYRQSDSISCVSIATGL